MSSDNNNCKNEGYIATLFRQFGFSCSHTTRGRRDGEQEGVHYHFTNMESMKAQVANGDFIEHAEVCVLFFAERDRHTR